MPAANPATGIEPSAPRRTRSNDIDPFRAHAAFASSLPKKCPPCLRKINRAPELHQGPLGLVTGITVPAWRDSAGNHALSLAVALHSRAELLNHADRLMTDGQAALDGIFPLQDVNVGSTDCSRRDPDKCVQRTNIRDRLLVENDTAGFDKHRCFHFLHHGPLFDVSFI